MGRNLMAKFISDEEMSKLELAEPKKKSFISDDEMDKIDSGSNKGYDWSNAPRDLLQTNVDALPLYGAALGGALGMGVASVPMAGAFSAAGESLKNGINQLLHGDDSKKFGVPQTPVDIANKSVEAFNSGATQEMGGQVIAKGLQAGSQAIAPSINKAKNSIGNSLKDTADSLAARALGTERGSVNKMGIDKVKQAGRYALDEGIITPLASTDDMLERALARKAVGGQKMGEVYSKIDDAGKSTFNPLDEAANVEKKIGDFWRSPINKSETGQLENTLEAITMRGDKNIPIKEAQILKEELGKVAKWNSANVTDKEQMARDAYGIISKRIDEVVDQGATSIGTDDLLALLKEGKRDFSNSSTAESLLKIKQAREQGNKLIGLTDTIFGSGAIAVSGPAAIGAVGTKKVIDGYGAQNAALGLDKVSKYLLKSPKMLELSKNSPQIFQSIVQKFEKSFAPEVQQIQRAAENEDIERKPDVEKPGAQVDKDKILNKLQGSKYAQVLQNAADKGEKSFSAAHFVLSQRDVNYRKQLEDQV